MKLIKKEIPDNYEYIISITRGELKLLLNGMRELPFFKKRFPEDEDCSMEKEIEDILT